MFEYQLAVFQSMNEMTQSLSANYAKTLEEVWGLATTAKPGGAAPGHDAPCDKHASSSESNRLSMPEIPQSGQSWYKPPSENPVLVFWDEMLKPWRTMMPGGNVTGDLTAGPIAVFGLMSAPGLAGFPAPNGSFQIPGPAHMGLPPKLPVGPMADVSDSLKKALDEWSSVWQSLLTPTSSGGASKVESPATTAEPAGELDAVTESWKTLIAFHSDSGMAMARVFFPDHTIVTMQVPVPTMPFVPTSGMPNT